MEMKCIFCEGGTLILLF